jgi:predicted membrane protein
MKPERFDQIASTRLLVGLWLIGLGAIFMLGYLDVIETRRVMRYFAPLMLMFIGTAMVIHPTRTRRQRLGWVLIAVGGWIFLNKLGWVDVSIIKLLFPAMLLTVGGMLVWRAFSAPKLSVASTSSLPQQEEQHAEFMRCFAVISSNELRPVSRPFRGADLSAVMAGIKLNLLDARMETETASIEVFAFWGGMEIYVPPEWTVVSKVATLMGGFIDKRRPTTVVPTKTLIISGFVVMSGIEIKN